MLKKTTEPADSVCVGLEINSIGLVMCALEKKRQGLEICDFRCFYSNGFVPVKIKNKNIALSIPYEQVILKRVTIDSKLKDADIMRFIQEKSPEYFDCAFSEVNFDYAMVADHGATQEIAVVATRRDEIAARLKYLKKYGIKISVIDVDVYALIRVVQLFLSGKECEMEMALVFFNEGRAIFSVFKRQVPEYIKVETLEDDGEASEEQRRDGYIERMNRFLQFYSANQPGGRIIKLFVLGNEVVNQASSQLATFAGLRICQADVLSKLTVSECVDRVLLENSLPRMIVSLGLALGKFTRGN